MHDTSNQTIGIEGITVGLSGRHELYVESLAALLSSRGADVRLLADPGGLPGEVPQVQVLLLESPLPSELRALVGGPPVIVIAEQVDERPLHGAGDVGAVATLDKNVPLARLVQAVRQALVKQGGEAAAPADLTRRQRQVLRLLARGLDNAQIAAELAISPRTAREHVSAILERLGASNRTQAAVTAVQRGWIAEP